MQIFTVREIELRDLDLLADYWLKSDADFLINMGVDLNKLPTRKMLINMLSEQLNLSYDEKKSYALIWEHNGGQIGHSNVNNIKFGKEATMHLHIWNQKNRMKGIGVELINESLKYYFNKLQLKKIICEPYALNPGPNRTLEKVGFHFVKEYETIPGSLNFLQYVNRWELSKENYLKKVNS